MTGAAQVGKRGDVHLGRWFKGAVALLLLTALSWVGLVAYQYFQTGKPIAQIPAMPKPIAKLVQEQPQFSSSIWNVARPLGVAAAPDGTIYVTESAGDRMVRSFSASGASLASWATADDVNGRSPMYVAVSPAGKVYVSDIERHAILIYTADGQAAGEVASPVGEKWIPGALAFDNAGNLYATEMTPGQHRVLVFDPSGALTLQFGQEGAERGQFEFPNGIAVDSKGNIFVADSGNGRVQAFDKTGAPVFVIGRGSARADLGMPRGIAVDEGRHLLLVVDATAQAVNAYDISGANPKLAYQLGGEVGGSSLLYPNGIALDNNGHILVADKENQRIAVWRY